MEQSLRVGFPIGNINLTFPPQSIGCLNFLFMQKTDLMKINSP